jgi:hypothetical protein
MKTLSGKVNPCKRRPGAWTKTPEQKKSPGKENRGRLWKPRGTDRIWPSGKDESLEGKIDSGRRVNRRRRNQRGMLEAERMAYDGLGGALLARSEYRAGLENGEGNTIQNGRTESARDQERGNEVGPTNASSCMSKPTLRKSSDVLYGWELVWANQH